MKFKFLISLLLMLPFISSCGGSESNGGEESVKTSLSFVSSNPANGATDVSIDITNIELTFNQNVKLLPMGLLRSTLNGSKLSESDVTYGTNTLNIALSNVSANTSYELIIPANMITTSDGKTAYTSEINIKFTTEKNTLNITPDVSPNSNGMTSDAIAWTKKIYAGWDLGNTFESVGGTWNESSKTWSDVYLADFNEWETAWGNPKVTADMIKAVKDAGFNAVRMPVRWFPHVTDESTMEIDSRWIGRVKEVVDYCINNDMYVIVNTHHDLWMENNPLDSKAADISKKEIALWRNIATYFRDYDEHLVFAGTNEVNIDWKAPTEENYRVQNGFNQDFVKAVRSTGGRNWYRPLVVQTYSSNPNYGLAGFVTPADVVDNRLIVEFHYYDPYDYCGSCTVYYFGKEYEQYGISTSSQEEAMQSLFAQLAERFHPQGMGVLMGETGVAYHTKGTSAEVKRQEESMKYYLKTVYSTAKANGIAPFVWDNNAFGNGSENFGIFNRNKGMNVDRSFMLEGIMEGAKTNYPN